ncbi:Transposase-like protein (plasmid) [Escherichia coli O55:H7 str. RM12579]|nr:Transposase-like protein [Escherichia coli O55:H7 str. CB9615]AEZ43675.1 Transposase-like protein [Escherichia coli O55:H7 str. RM12579]EIL11114.1 Transposase-like protein [Escherichia coli O103:H25 str. CVM9340]
MVVSLFCQGLKAKASRKFNLVCYRAHGLPVSENLLELDFYASDRTRNGRKTSRTYVQMKVGCIRQWSLTCGHVSLFAGRCRHV